MLAQVSTRNERDLLASLPGSPTCAQVAEFSGEVVPSSFWGGERSLTGSYRPGGGMAMDSGEVTKLLREYGAGDAAALDRLVPLVYDELKRVASAQLRNEGHNHLQTTSLVHEAYMRLADGGGLSAEDRSHFLSIAARAMRRILIDAARRRSAQKRGGGAAHVTLDPNGPPVWRGDLGLLALDDALRKLTELDPRQGAVVEYRIFADMTVEDTAEALRVSVRTVKRDWQAARAWLNRELRR